MADIIKGAAELGIIYAVMALGVFISFRTLNMPDLTVDSSFTLGAACSAMLCVSGSRRSGSFWHFSQAALRDALQRCLQRS